MTGAYGVFSGSKRIAVSTGGGDAPGLNAVIRAVVHAGLNRGWEIMGVKRGFGGLLGETQVWSMDREDVRGLTNEGGTILGTTNRGNPFRWPTRQSDGTWVEVDRSDEVVETARLLGINALIAVGGDGTLRIASDLAEKGLPVVGVPKTIDNDVAGTWMTFGFDTAVNTATDAFDKIESTAESHERVMVVELMGRHAGWITLHAGLAGSVHVILIPEIPFDLEKVCDKIRQREALGRHFSVVAVAEGAVPAGGVAVLKAEAVSGGVERLGGIANLVAEYIQKRTNKEARTVTLGHLQRGGRPTTFDRLLALRFGAAAVRAVEEGRTGHMVAFHPPDVTTVPLQEALAAPKLVPLDCDQIRTARDLGISLGD
ncbi:MAG: 6-phosphofructokinase [Gemmatimonas sp. SG8_17]|nr:MAG: 6-phosphofructokinase [Gemmatimonas sp. SG8_17]